MSRERPIAGEGRVIRRALTLAGLFAAIAAPAAAQDAADDGGQNQVAPAFEAGSPLLKQNANRRFGLDTGSNGLPRLRGPGGLDAPLAPGIQSTDPGVANGGEGIARLPRFRTGGQAISSLSGGVSGTQAPSLLRRRAAPPRRFTLPTKALVKQRTQDFVTDLRLTPVIQTPVSGIPQLAAVPLPTAIPLLGLISPSGFLYGLSPRGPSEADPAYAPLGIKLGTLTVFPAFTQSIGYDTNPDQTTRRLARGSLASRSEGELAYRSDWSSSELSGELRGGYLAFPDNEGASRPNAAGVNRLRIDVNRDTRLDVEAHFLVDTQRFGSPDLGFTTRSRPIFATYGGSVGVTENLNRLLLSARATVDRQIFEDAELTNGTRLVQSDRNANQYGVRLRAGYEISPSVTPFVETILDTRVYDMSIDLQGFRRDSDGVGFTAGAAFAPTRFITGEISAGMQHREYVDRRLRAINAPLVNAALIWQVSPLTTVRLSQQTGIIETSVPGSSGVSTDVATAEVQHDLLRNLSITVGGAYLSNKYEGVRIRETGFSALSRLDYRFNRWLTFRGSYIYQQIHSTSPGASFSDNLFLLGIRINP